MDCGTGDYRRLMQQYPLVTDAFLALDEKFQAHCAALRCAAALCCAALRCCAILCCTALHIMRPYP